MSDDMLMSFDSPAAREVSRAPVGLLSPLIPYPSTPFDCLTSQVGDDPFEVGARETFDSKPSTRHVDPKPQTPERSFALGGPTIVAGTPSPILLRRAVSDVDITGRFLVSSTPLVSNNNTPTRSSRHAPRRSVFNADESISCALVRSKLDFINKVKMGLVSSQRNSSLSKWRSNPNLSETLDTSVQHKIFSCSKGIVPGAKAVVDAGHASANDSAIGSIRIDHSSFVLDQEEAPMLETSAFQSFLTSSTPMVSSKPTPEEIRAQAKKMEFSFSLCADVNHDPHKREQYLIESQLPPDSWFDDCLDFEDLQIEDSDEDVMKIENPIKSKQEMDSIKARISRIRRSSGCEASPKETTEAELAVKSSPAPVVESAAGKPTDVAPELPIPKLPPVLGITEMRPKSATAPVKRGPLKAVEPIPNMIKKTHSKTDLLKARPSAPNTGAAKGRPSRPSTAQERRRTASPASRRTSSVSPQRSPSNPPTKNIRPPVKLPGLRPKVASTTGKENRP